MNRTRRAVILPALSSLLLTFWLLPAPAWSWGQNGHRVVGEIAWRHLTPEAQSQVLLLLLGDSLAQAGTWADEIRSEPGWFCAAPFHYITVPAGTEYPAAQAVREGDAGQAVVYYTDVLADATASDHDRGVALRFLTHLVADLHQPLHIGLGCDRGGNDISVQWFDEETNLHSIWDTEILESLDLSYTELVDFIDRAAPPQVAAGVFPDWIREAQELFPAVYTCFTENRGDRCPCYCGDCESGLSTFGGCAERSCELKVAGPVRMRYQYKSRALPIVQDRLLKAGLRLAALLNWTLAKSPQAPANHAAFAAKVRALPDWDAALKTCRGQAPPPNP